MHFFRSLSESPQLANDADARMRWNSVAFAAREKQYEHMMQLLIRGEDVESTWEGRTALTWVIENGGGGEPVRALLRYGVNPLLESEDYPLHKCVEKEDKEIFNLLVRLPYDLAWQLSAKLRNEISQHQKLLVNQRNARGKTALDLVAELGRNVDWVSTC